MHIVIEGGEHVVVDHNITAADVQIEVRGAGQIEIRGNQASESLWWKRPVGIIALSVAAGLIVALVKYSAGW